jgi:signal transduction histidine kinase/CheY-like chemotaxis protein
MTGVFRAKVGSHATPGRRRSDGRAAARAATAGAAMSLSLRFALQFGLTATLGVALALAISLGVFRMRVETMSQSLGDGLEQAIETQLREDGEALLDAVGRDAREALLAYDRAALDRIARQGLSRSDALSVRIYDSHGRALADGGGDARVFEVQAPAPMRDIAKAPGVVRWAEGDRLLSARPVCIGPSCVGAVAVAVDGGPIARERAAVEADMAAAKSAFFLEATAMAAGALALAAGVAAFVGWLLGRRLTASLRSAVAGLEQLAAGATAVSIDARDSEMKELAAAVDKVADRLAQGRLEGDTILAEMADGLFVAAAGGEMLVANPALHELVAAEPPELVGADAFALFGAPRTADVAAFAAAVSAARRMKGPGGKTAEVIVSARTGGDPGRGQRVIGVVRAASAATGAGADPRLIEAQVRAEAAEKAKSEFLSVMSHELRTPLNGVLGGAAVLAGSDLNPVQRSIVGMMQNSGKALLTMVTDILDYAKADAQDEPPERDPVHLEAVARDVADRVQAAAKAKGLELFVRVQPGAPVVLSDADKLIQIGQSLAENAVKYTKSGHVGIDLSHRVRDGVAEFTLTVDDSGVGIPADKLDAIFEPFTQGDSSAIREGGGAGMGLALTKKLSEALGGSVSVESAPGMGSTFRVTLSADVDPAAEPPAPPAALLGERVLVAAPSERERSALAEQFLAAGAVVETAGTAADAEAALREALAQGQPFGAVIHPEDLKDFEASGLAQWLRGDQAARETASVVLRPSGERADAAGLPDRVQYAPEPGTNASLLDAAAAAAAARSAPPADDWGAGRAAAGAAAGGAPGERPDLSVVAAPPPTPRILLAEPNEVNRIVLGAYLRKAGYEVETVENGFDAVRAFKAQRPTLVLMDVDMPVMNGLEATKSIRRQETDEEATPVPVIGLAANRREGERDRCAAAGMNDMLSKPIKMDDLEAKLERWTTLFVAKAGPASLAS